MRISDVIRQAKDRRTRKHREPDSDADTPGNYKRQTGRCPPGYFVNDDTGRCEKVSTRKQKMRDRKNRKLRTNRKMRRNRHPKINRHSEFDMKISQQVSGKTLSEKSNSDSDIKGIDKHIQQVVKDWSKKAGDLTHSIRKLLRDMHQVGIKDKRYEHVAKAFGDVEDAMEHFVDQMYELQKQSVGELEIKGEVVKALRAKIREGAGDAFTFISAVKQIGTSLSEIMKQADRAKKAMPVAGKMIDVMLKHVKAAGAENNKILKKVKSAIDDR
jgi:uncharacterized protein YoxC